MSFAVVPVVIKKRIDSHTSPTVVRFLCSGRQSLCLQQHGGNMSVY
jgi:hypothetical protein